MTAPSRLRAGFAIGVILAIGAALRLARLGAHSLWSDEMFVLWVSRFSWHDLLRVVTVVDFHPPLYYVLMKTWIGLAGAGEAALRTPSACLSILGVWLTYALMRKASSDQVGLLSALVVAVAPFHVMAGQEARMYPLLGALALGSTLALANAVERGGVLRWALYMGLGALMAYTAYLGALVLAAHGAWVVGWERRHLGRWLAAMGGVACLFAPWAPSFWTQVAQARGLDQIVTLHETPPAPSLSVTVWQLGDLFGLFAFGGSLFGAAGYFSSSSLSSLERVIVLLPFAVTVWLGVVSFTSDRRGLALLGLPPLVAIGVTAALSLAKPIFLPRWFSFLLPFWAMLLARGIAYAAERVRDRPDRAAAWLTIGLLVYSAPALDRYYLDPATWPFRWRAAAELVAHRVKSCDFFMYADPPAAETFSYYFRERHPSLTLTGAQSKSVPAALTTAQARGLAARYPRVWLVVNGPVTPLLQQRVLPALASAYSIAGRGDFGGARVYLFEAPGEPARCAS